MNCSKRFLLAVGVGFAAVAAYAGHEATPSAVVVERFADVPVEAATGEVKHYPAPDFAIKTSGALGLTLGRNYKSRGDSAGIFGYGWNWTHGDKLVFNEDLTISYISADSTAIIEPDSLWTTRFARVCGDVSGWNNEAAATGEPDADGGYER